jgi:protein CpxP
MKRIISSLLVLVAFTAFAQTPAKSNTGHEQKTPEERATAMTAHLEKSLALTPEQKTKVYGLTLAREQKINQLRDANKGKDRCDWADQRKQTQDEFMAGMKQTLTPEQFTKWNAQKEAHQQHRVVKRAQSPKTTAERAENYASHLEKDLALTPEQKTQVQKLALTLENADKELREKYKGQDPCASKSERQQVRENFEKGMKGVLTPEQFQKWEAQKKEHMEQRKEQKHPQKK